MHELTTPGTDIISNAEDQGRERWFRARVEASLKDGKPTYTNDKVMADAEAIIAEAEEHARLNA